jgi:hypothetical protein
MEIKAFRGTVHVFDLKGKMRKVIDPRTIPAEIRDELCRRNNYWLDSIIGPNHDVAHFDLTRQNWRDMRHAVLQHTLSDQPITYDGAGLSWV